MNSYAFVLIHWSCRYHVPRSWLKGSGNTIVLFEEKGGDPTQISFATREITSLCSHVSESHPRPVEMWTSDQTTGTKRGGALVSLECPLPSQVISSIKFASYGNPHGTCGSFSHGRCRSVKALSVVQKVWSLSIFDIEFGPARGIGLHGNTLVPQMWKTFRVHLVLFLSFPRILSSPSCWIPTVGWSFAREFRISKKGEFPQNQDFYSHVKWGIGAFLGSWMLILFLKFGFQTSL